LQQWDNTCEKIKRDLLINISGFLQHILSKLGFALIKEIIRLTSEENVKIKEMGEIAQRQLTKKDTDTLQTEFITMIKDMEALSQQLVDNLYPDYLPVKYQYLYKIL